MEFWLDEEGFTEEHVQRAHSDEELRAYLDEAGFEVDRTFDSYTLDHPRKKSDRVHYVAILRTR